MLSSLILCNNNKLFLNWIVTCDRKWIVYDNWLSGWAEKLQSTSQSQTCTKKGHGHWLSADSLIHYNFLNPGETIPSEKYAQQIDEMQRKLQCLQPASVSRKGPILLHDNAWPHIVQPTLQSWMNRATKFCHIHHIHLTSCQPTTAFSSILTTFCKENVSKAAGCRKCFPRVCWIPRHGFLCYRNKTFLFGKNVLIVMAPIFD